MSDAVIGTPAAAGAPEPRPDRPSTSLDASESPEATAARKKRRRGSRGGRGRSGGGGGGDRVLGSTAPDAAPNSEVDAAVVAPKPKIGDTRPAFGTIPPPPGPRRTPESSDASPT